MDHKTASKTQDHTVGVTPKNGAFGERFESLSSEVLDVELARNWRN